MAFSSNYWTIPGVLAGADLSGAQYKIVKFASTAGEVVLASAATDSIAGVLMNDPTDGQPAEVAYAGIVKVQAEASQTRGVWVAASTTGRAKATTTGNDDIVGKILEASTAAGDLVPMMLTIGNF